MKSFYRPDIDGLRAVSVAAVIVYHAFPKVLPGGFVGVDVFFVISGFLISSLLFNEMSTDTFSLTAFYGRRARRILPALLLVVAAVFSVGTIVMFSDERAMLGRHIMASATFVSNFNLWAESGYFDEAAEFKPLMHLWSLAIEEQFYLFWPLVLLTLHRGFNQRLAVLIGLTTCSFAACLVVVRFDPVAAFFNPLTRFWELMLGATVAYLRHACLTANNLSGLEIPQLERRLRNAIYRLAEVLHEKLGYDRITLIGLALIGGGFLLLSKHSSHPGLLTLLPTLGATIIVASGDAKSATNRALSAPAMVAVGLISYPLYLWHWPMLSLSLLTTNAPLSITWRLAVILLTIAFATGTYFLLEKPLRSGRWLNEKAIALGLMLPVFFIAGESIRRSSNEAASSQPIISDWSRRWRDGGCTPTEISISKDCRASGKGVNTVAIIGDSYAQAMYVALAELSDTSTGIIRFGAAIPFLDIAFKLEAKSPPWSADQTNKILRYVSEQKSIKTVILAFRGVIAYEGTDYDASNSRLYHGRRLGLDMLFQNENDVAFRQGMLTTLKALESAGKDVVFILDNPELSFNPKQCAPARPHVSWGYAGRTPCAEPRNLFENRSRSYRSAVREIVAQVPSVRVFDLALPLCDQLWCWAVRDGKILYQDFNHLSDDGLRLVAPALVAEVFGKQATSDRH